MATRRRLPWRSTRSHSVRQAIFFIQGNPELLGHGLGVIDMKVDQGVRPSVALVLGLVQPDPPTRHADEPGEAGLTKRIPEPTDVRPGT